MKTVSRNLPSKQTTLHSGPKKEMHEKETETRRERERRRAGGSVALSAAFDMRLNRNGK